MCDFVLQWHCAFCYLHKHTLAYFLLSTWCSSVYETNISISTRWRANKIPILYANSIHNISEPRYPFWIDSFPKIRKPKSPSRSQALFCLFSSIHPVRGGGLVSSLCAFVFLLFHAFASLRLRVPALSFSLLLQGAHTQILVLEICSSNGVGFHNTSQQFLKLFQQHFLLVSST